MRLTQFSNFAVRILMYAGINKGQPSAVPDIARAYGIPLYSPPLVRELQLSY